MTKRATLICLLLSAAISACATDIGSLDPGPSSPTGTQARPVTDGIQAYLEARARVEKVSLSLRKAALKECQRMNQTKLDLGLVVWSLVNFQDDRDRAFLAKTLGLTNAITVAIAIEDGAAANAGLKSGDEIISLNGTKLSSGPRATEEFIAASNSAARKGSVNLSLANGRSVTLQPQAACALTTLLVRSPDVNAGADGQSIAVTTALAQMAPQDEDLALILSHEIAHILLGHERTPDHKPSSAIENSARIALAPLAMPSSPANNSIKREKEADRAGLVLMQRAGFRLNRSKAFLAELLDKTSSTRLAATHPGAPERLAAIEAALAEISAADAAGRSLSIIPGER